MGVDSSMMFRREPPFIQVFWQLKRKKLNAMEKVRRETMFGFFCVLYACPNVYSGPWSVKKGNNFLFCIRIKKKKKERETWRHIVPLEFLLFHRFTYIFFLQTIINE
jgi:hypothetical protein